ncbi:DUF433 domain-containing protein [Dolichospermum planctonicum]|uniref:DUF433 domain-containing protein n=1 Tax=Dolichospermum planctonicum TaxID=136072 RepID=UPI001C2BD141
MHQISTIRLFARFVPPDAPYQCSSCVSSARITSNPEVMGGKPCIRGTYFTD